jgi:hypothetical protein
MEGKGPPSTTWAIWPTVWGRRSRRDYYERALAIFQEIGAVDSVRVVAGNLAYLDSRDTASGEAPDAPPDTPAIPQEELPQQKRRRWPWQRQPAQI